MASSGSPEEREKAAEERFNRAVVELHAAAAELQAAMLARFRSAPAAQQKRPEERRRMAYRVGEVAKLLGVSVEHVTRAIERRELKARHMGGALLVLAGDLEAYLGTLD